MSRRGATNRYVGVNYLPLLEKMETPPEYWLQRLYDFDADLVVFPSTHVPYAYVLARRAWRSGGLRGQALAEVITQPDTRYCLTHNLVPVTMIYRTGLSWNIDNIIAELERRDIWRAGGGEKAADIADAADEQKRERIKKQTREDMWHRSGDAWRSYQARTGQRSRPTVGQKKKTQPATEHRPKRSSGSTGVTL